jgi:hypothetical protein
LVREIERDFLPTSHMALQNFGCCNDLRWKSPTPHYRLTEAGCRNATVFSSSGNFCLQQRNRIHVDFYPYTRKLLTLPDQGAAEVPQAGDTFSLEQELPAVSPLDPI